MSATLASALAGLALAATAAQPQLPTRAGETGLVDVPDAEVQGVGNGQLGAELRLDHQAGRPTRSGPLPLSAVGGLTQRLDLGFSMRRIAELLALWHDRSRPSRQVKALAEAHLRELDAKIAELQAMKATLAHLAHCCHGDDRPDCPILDSLADSGATR